MRRFTAGKCYAQADDHVLEFVHDYFRKGRKTLFISTLGIQPQSLFFPTQVFSKFPDVTFRIIIEKRRELSPTLSEIGKQHADYVSKQLSSRNLEFVEVDIVAKDGATIGGRTAVVKAREWYKDEFTDIVIDATGMSRGICFPLVQQAIEVGLSKNANVHLFVASSDHRPVDLKSESSDRAEWMHGFQQKMGLDSTADTMKLWVPQLSESAEAQMEMMYRALSASSSVAEVCPIVPFPSCKARRGDDLLYEFERDFHGEWDCSHLNVIYAHESNPMDVYSSISKMVSARKEVFSATDRKAVTVLSPCGWRIGSLGMLLAAIELELPMWYVETICYNTVSTLPPKVEVQEPDHLWHILLAGAPYENSQL